jgi:hypothetical protein
MWINTQLRRARWAWDWSAHRAWSRWHASRRLCRSRTCARSWPTRPASAACERLSPPGLSSAECGAAEPLWIGAPGKLVRAVEAVELRERAGGCRAVSKIHAGSLGGGMPACSVAHEDATRARSKRGSGLVIAPAIA